jgi:hypothetical protein
MDYSIILVSIWKLPVRGDKGRSGAFEEIVIRFQCTISKTGKALEANTNSDQLGMSRQIITSDEEVPFRPQSDFPDGNRFVRERNR